MTAEGVSSFAMDVACNCNDLLGVKDKEIADCHWMIKCLYFILLVLMVAFLAHYRKLMTDSNKLAEATKDLVFERTKNLMYENKISSLKHDLEKILVIRQQLNEENMEIVYKFPKLESIAEETGKEAEAQEDEKSKDV